MYAPDGSQLGELSLGLEPCGVATNPAGHVFVAFFSEIAPEGIKEYVPSANPLKASDAKAASSAEITKICNLAADGLGNLYVAHYAPLADRGLAYPPGTLGLAGLGALNATELDPFATYLAVDPATDNLYADREATVAQYDSSGSQVSVFGAGRLSKSEGIAVDGASGKVYVGDGGPKRIDVFGPQTTVATVATEPATDVKPHTANLHALVNPEGIEVTECVFEYGPTTAYGETAPCQSIPPTDEGEHPVSAALGGLQKEATYHFRVVVTDANGPSPGEDLTFTTPSPALTQPAEPVGGIKATLNGLVFPEGEEVTECAFEYGPTTAYGETAPCQSIPPTDEGEHAVSAAIGHLTPNGVTYHFRLRIERADGAILGRDLSFKTAETVKTGGVGAIVPPTATVEGSVDPEGVEVTECLFEYGPSSELGSTVPCDETPAEIGTGAGPVAVHAQLSGLVFESTYHYRLVVANEDGAVEGKEANFNTPGSPTIEAEYAGAVTEGEAHLVARVNPRGLPTTYHVEFGTTSGYGQSTEELEVGADEAVHALTSVLSGLAADTTYHWRVVAVNSHGDATGPDRSFTTFPVAADETGCPNQQLRTGPSADLPDCRAYELVSPAQKAGQVIPPDPDEYLSGSCGDSTCLPRVPTGQTPMQARPDGEAVVYLGQPFSIGLSAEPNDYLARRTAAGWQTQSLNPGIVGGKYAAFSADLASGVLRRDNPALSPQAPLDSEGRGYPNLYLRGAGGAFQPLLTAAPPHRHSLPEAREGKGAGLDIQYAGANAGTSSVAPSSHLIFAANDALTGAGAFAPAAPEATFSLLAGALCELHPTHCDLYEWTGGGLRLVNVLPGNAEAFGASGFGAGKSQLLELPEDVDHAISDDGSRIFWSSAPEVRVEEASAGVQTVTVLGSSGENSFTLAFEGQRTAPIEYGAGAAAVRAALEALPSIGAGKVEVSGANPYTVTFQGTLAGTSSLLTGETPSELYVRIDGEETRRIEDPGEFLTASADGAEVLLSDGCLYDVAAARCEADLSKGHGGFQGILGAPADLSRVYFVDTAVLSGEEEPERRTRPSGRAQPLLPPQGATTFIATLLEQR